MSKVHKLKTVQPFYGDVASGKKPFEVRFNDRDYQVGDYLVLQEYDVENDKYSGRETDWLEIMYILDNPQFCKEGYVIMGFRNIRLNSN